MTEETKETEAKAAPMPVTFVEKPAESVAVIDKEAEKKARAAEKAAERKAMARLRQQFNGVIMRVRIKNHGDAADAMERVGLRKMGYGYYYAGGYNADEIIARIEEQIEHYMAKGSDDVVVELRKAQIALNAQIIQLGDSHIEATKEAASRGAQHVHVAFPAGQPVVVATGKGSDTTDSSMGNTEKLLTNGEPST